jgi:hypothetical protein
MATENFDGYSHVDEIMKRALKEDIAPEEIKESYAVWYKTYEKVNRNFSNSEREAAHRLIGANVALSTFSVQSTYNIYILQWWVVEVRSPFSLNSG